MLLAEFCNSRVASYFYDTNKDSSITATDLIMKEIKFYKQSSQTASHLIITFIFATISQQITMQESPHNDRYPICRNALNIKPGNL